LNLSPGPNYGSTNLDEEDRLFEDNVGLSAPEIEKSTLWNDVWLEDKDDEVTEG
jgi:hypothetical protein